jgi:DNA polymerase-3 subunit epsilon
MVDRIPRTGVPKVDRYLAMLDNALLDRNISATEADSLVDIAYEIGLHHAEAVQAHHDYLHDIARAAWADGIVTDAERANLVEVAQLLGLDSSAVDDLLDTKPPLTSTSASRSRPTHPNGLTLKPGLSIVMTGAMKTERATWVKRAEAAGLIVGKDVTKKTQLLVTADPDTLSGKARKARLYGIPVVSEEAFATAIDCLITPSP